MGVKHILKKEKVKASVSKGHRMTNNSKTPVPLPQSFHGSSWPGAPAFTGIGAQLLPRLAEGVALVLRKTEQWRACPQGALQGHGVRPQPHYWTISQQRGSDNGDGTALVSQQPCHRPLGSSRLERCCEHRARGTPLSPRPPCAGVPLGSWCRAHQLHRTGSASHRC